MAKATTRSWTKMSIWVGDGASPTQDFTARHCGITTKEFTIEATPSETETPDCDDPDAPAWVERAIRSLSAGISGNGVMAEEIFPFYREWMLSGESRSVRIALELGTPGYFEGLFILTTLGLPASREDGRIGTALELQSDGPIVWANGAP